jgi:2-keto-3-deoxy-L-rhamnonate aldolase RhmA
VLVICQIETGKAVANAVEIAAVADVDLLFIGPFDLSASMGYLGEPDHPEVRAAIAEVEAKTKEAGKLLGGIATPGRGAAELLAAGYDLILQDSDLSLLRESARASAAHLRKILRGGRIAG